ncbi:ABC transporter permease [Mariniblastus fucicola]|uniref:FtsX-like permease family protein n=1 Tax=Mariniblastus fucicola TaxID=980251 RepID=A0A5B9PKA6_9BACT|nr:ABC transporter permease [Mariniblastus fucicola]QEG23091.1 FtsX-like permease family protein [Mariniblastus fucicola]
MLLPWEYGVRNLARRPLRTALTLVALSTVILLVFVVVGFIRGLERSLTISGDPDVVLVYSISSEENIENSAIAAQIPNLLTASVGGTLKRFGTDHVSPELYLGTRVSEGGARGSGDSENKNQNVDEGGLGLVRGVTISAPLVRGEVKLTDGHWPGKGEVIVGKLASAKMGLGNAALANGSMLNFEGQSWKVVGHFAAGGASFESELWCNLTELQSATKRQDLTLVALKLEPGASHAEVQLFCKERTDLELRAIGETEYYQSLQQHYKPVRVLAWLVVLLVSGAGVFAGLNMMYGAIAGRIREIATLQAIGYRRRAILLSILQEGVLLAAAASLIAGVIALLMLNGLAIRFTMGAFVLNIDGIAVLLGCGVGLMLGVLGALPPALKALRSAIATSLKAV